MNNFIKITKESKNNQQLNNQQLNNQQLNNQQLNNQQLNNNEFKRVTNIKCKENLLMNSLIKYFSKEEYLNTFLPILEGKSQISLRLIDWFVTNYCKKYNTIYKIKSKESNKKSLDFNVYFSYKTQLKSFSKNNLILLEEMIELI